MGLTNYIKNKLEKHPHTTKALNATKQGATKTYEYAKKAVNSPQLEKIGKASTGIAKGIDQGAGLFNTSLGFGNDTTNNLKIWPDKEDFSYRPKQRHIKKGNRKQTIIIRHEYGPRHQRQEHRSTRRTHERRKKEWQIGDMI
jgi:hypothetical protein